MKNVEVVIGANFGDEGKGLTTDYLASKALTEPLIVRFNGGAQAGHTVEQQRLNQPNLRHVFHHFGSGTLVGAPTFLSKYFIVNPILFLKEFEELRKIVSPKVFISSDCLVTTPYDMMINQFIEEARSSWHRHGSCGVGINETVTRSEMPRFRLTMNDVMKPRSDVTDTIKAIRDEYVFNRLLTLGFTDVYEKYESVFTSDDILDRYVEDLLRMTSQIHRLVSLENTDKFFDEYEHVIFEGAQGLLLDEFHPWFPHVTRSRTGMINVTEMLNQHNYTGKVDVHYVTRSYLTRHGAGPFPGELLNFQANKIQDRTNIPNRYQGTIRFAPFDPTLFSKTVKNDFNIARANSTGAQLSISTMLTCVDQYDSDQCPKANYQTLYFVNEVAKLFYGKMLISSGPSSSAVEKYEVKSKQHFAGMQYRDSRNNMGIP